MEDITLSLGGGEDPYVEEGVDVLQSIGFLPLFPSTGECAQVPQSSCPSTQSAEEIAHTSPPFSFHSLDCTVEESDPIFPPFWFSLSPSIEESNPLSQPVCYPSESQPVEETEQSNILQSPRLPSPHSAEEITQVSQSFCFVSPQSVEANASNPVSRSICFPSSESGVELTVHNRALYQQQQVGNTLCLWHPAMAAPEQNTQLRSGLSLHLLTMVRQNPNGITLENLAFVEGLSTENNLQPIPPCRLQLGSRALDQGLMLIAPQQAALRSGGEGQASSSSGPWTQDLVSEHHGEGQASSSRGPLAQHPVLEDRGNERVPSLGLPPPPKILTKSPVMDHARDTAEGTEDRLQGFQEGEEKPRDCLDWNVNVTEWEQARSGLPNPPADTIVCTGSLDLCSYIPDVYSVGSSAEMTVCTPSDKEPPLVAENFRGKDPFESRNLGRSHQRQPRMLCPKPMISKEQHRHLLESRAKQPRSKEFRLGEEIRIPHIRVGDNSQASSALHKVAQERSMHMTGLTLGQGSNPNACPQGEQQQILQHALAQPGCRVDGCTQSLALSKDYFRRHRVCDFHSKEPKVLIASVEQRFCQQCSRFELLAEFDQGRRSCRKRLEGHNRRRRKNPVAEPPSEDATRIAELANLEQRSFASQSNATSGDKRRRHMPEPAAIPPSLSSERYYTLCPSLSGQQENLNSSADFEGRDLGQPDLASAGDERVDLHDSLDDPSTWLRMKE